MPRPIFVGFPLAEVRMRGLVHKRVGDTFSVLARFIKGGGGSENLVLRGEVLFISDRAHGKLLILRNSHKGDWHYHCSGWTYIPIWLGCDQNGVIASWKDVDAQSHLEAQRAIDEYRAMCETRKRERLVASAMAL